MASKGPEAKISRGIRQALAAAGFAVYSTEQGYRPSRGGTRMTPGIPDLYVMGRDMSFWVEVKTPKGKLSEAQSYFATLCGQNDVTHFVWRSVDDALDWLRDQGLIL